MASGVIALREQSGVGLALRALSVLVGLAGIALLGVAWLSPAPSVVFSLMMGAGAVQLLLLLALGVAWFCWRGFGRGRPGPRAEGLIWWLTGFHAPTIGSVGFWLFVASIALFAGSLGLWWNGTALPFVLAVIAMVFVARQLWESGSAAELQGSSRPWRPTGSR